MSYTQVDQLEVVIGANADQLRQELVGVTKQLNTLAKTGQSALKGKLVPSLVAGQMGANLLTKTIRNTVNGIKSLTKEVITQGAAYSRITIATDTVAQNMGIASDEIDNLRLSLAEANTYGIAAEKVIRSLAMTGLFQMAEGLEAVDARSGATEHGISALVLTMKDLAASAGMDSVEGIELLTRFIQGNAEAVQQGVLQIGNLGTEYRQYAQEIGKTRTELTAQQEAQVRMNIIMREGTKAFGAYANTYISSGKMMSSITEAMQSAIQIFGLYLEPILATATSAVLTFVNNLRIFLLDNESSFRQWAVKVSAYIIAVVRTIGRLLSNIPSIGKYMGNLADFEFPKLSVSASNTAKSMNSVGQSMSNTADNAKSLKKELAGLAGFDEMNVLKPKEEDTSGITGLDTSGLSTGLADVTSGFADMESFADDVNEHLDEAETHINSILESLQPIIDFMEPIIEFFTKHWKTILIVLATIKIISWLVGIISMAFTIIPALIGGIGTVLGVVASVLAPIIAAIGWLPIAIAAFVAIVIAAVILIIKNWDKISETLKAVWIIIKDTAKKVWDKIWGFVKDVADAIVTLWKDDVAKVTEFFNNLGEKIKNVWNNVTGWVEDKWNNTVNSLRDKIDRLKGWFKDLWNKIKGWASDAWEGIKRQFRQVADFFGNIFRNAWQKVKNVFSSGGSIFRGIKDGIASTFKNVVNRLIGGINNVIAIPFRAIDRALTTIRNTSIAGFRPFTWLPYVYTPRIPYLAEGGVIESPTVAMLGEAGAEAVVPLDNNNAWINELAKTINQKGGNLNLTIKLGEKDIYKGFIDYTNERSLAGNSKLIRI
jgi:phage-related protein